MEIKSTDSSSRLGQDQQEAGLNTTGELNLYFDLLAFSELSPEELLADTKRLKDAGSNQVLETGIDFPGFVEVAALEETAESNPVFEPLPAAVPVAIIEPDDAPLQVQTPEPPAPPVEKDIFRASGPLSLSGFLFDPASKAAAQVMTLAVCATCGSESDGEELFCSACGTFMDETTASEPAGLVCDDCGLLVATDELICPACGTVSVVC